jgi:hypothetical protein
MSRFDADYIPSAPWNPHAMSQLNPQHLVLPDDTAVRRRPVESRFDPETGILTIDLWFHNPEKDDVKEVINQAIRNARPRGLRKIVIIIAAETFANIDAYQFFVRNCFERRLADEPAGFIRMEKAA